MILSSEGVALALQGGEDPALLPVLVDKRHGGDGRHQLSLLFSTSMVPKFVEGLGAYGAYQYSFSDLIGIEISGGYLFASESTIMDEVRINFPATTADGHTYREPPLSDLFQVQWLAQADLVLVPIYGKISFASELDPSFDFFFLAGGGVAGARRQLGNADDAAGITHQTTVTPAFNIGGGLRFYFSRLLALRVEFRDYFFPQPKYDPVGHLSDADLAMFQKDYDNANSGFSWNLHFQAGLQFSFGGDE